VKEKGEKETEKETLKFKRVKEMQTVKKYNFPRKRKLKI
jgi:hypothetical protein